MTAPLYPKLADVVRRGVDEGAAALHVSIPARVERVDLENGLIDAKPLVQDKVEIDGELQTISVPVVTNVPIIWPGANGFRITFPMAVGDTVLLVFSDRSMDLWLQQDGEVDPVDPRRHDLSDAVAIPGLRSLQRPWTGASSTAATAGKDGGPQVVFKDSTVHVGAYSDAETDEEWNLNGERTYAFLQDLLDRLNRMVLRGMNGPVGPPDPGTFLIHPDDFATLRSGTVKTKR